jgi:hypothetical protein
MTLLIPDKAAADAWIANAMAGEQITYFVGELAVDRDAQNKLCADRAAAPAVSAVAKAFLQAADGGLVALTQRPQATIALNVKTYAFRAERLGPKSAAILRKATERFWWKAEPKERAG